MGNSFSRMPTEPKLLPQEEVTYAEPVLVPSANNALHSPKNTLRKAHNPNNAETLFQFSDNYTPPYGHQRGRDNFGTLRSEGYRGGRNPDGFGTTGRSVKKVYLWETGGEDARGHRSLSRPARQRHRGGAPHPLATSSPPSSASSSSPSPPSSSPSPPHGTPPPCSFIYRT